MTTTAARVSIHAETEAVDREARSARNAAIARLRRVPDLFRRYQSLSRLFDGDDRRHLLFWYHVGRAVDYVQRNSATYGSESVDTLAAALDKSRGAVYKAMAMFRTWPSLDAFRSEAIDREGPGGYKVGSTHLFSIIEIHADPEAEDIYHLRREMVDLCIEKALSYRALRAEMALRYPGDGSRPTTPAAVSAAASVSGLTKVGSAAQKWAAQMDQWNQEVITPMTAETLAAYQGNPAQLTAKLDQNIEALEDLAARASAGADRLKRLRASPRLNRELSA